MRYSDLTVWLRGSTMTFGAMALAGCQKAHSALAPVTPQAAGIAKIWWIFFSVCVAVYLIVMAVVIATAIKHRTTSPQPPGPGKIEPAYERRIHRTVTWATAVTVVILVGLLGADLWAQRELGPPREHQLTIRLTGHQWWWSAEYQNPNASDVFETANELHVPVGRPIQLLLESQDVIHSFWVPRLHGKRDLVPNHPGSISFLIEQPGRYEGFCAEFCGYQHAHMGIFIVAEDPAKYDAWAQAQRGEAPEPTTDRQRRGREIVETTTCSMCHTVHGTTAHSRAGPVLTHFAGRKTLGAGAAENTRERLAAWITDPNSLKPGVRMPPNSLSQDDLNALLDYLQILQ